MDAGHPWLPALLLLALAGVAVGLAGDYCHGCSHKTCSTLLLFVAVLFYFDLFLLTTTGGHDT